MRTLPITAVVLMLCVLAFATTVSAEQAPPPALYRIIVNPKNPVTALDRRFLQDAFLKKTRYWPGDKVIKPVDLTPSSSVRDRFTQEVLGRSTSAIRAYWQQRIFSGRDVPPPELASDQKVVEYVLQHAEAVGYVSGAAELAGSKVVRLTR